jgi:beta-glucosidase
LKRYGSNTESVKFIYEQGLSFSRDTVTTNFSKAIMAAKQADHLFFCGEEAILSGEAHCLEGDLKGAQTALIEALSRSEETTNCDISNGRKTFNY